MKEYRKKVHRKPNRETVSRFNSTVIGIQNYYKIATNIALDLKEVKRGLEISLYNRLEDNRKRATINDMSDTLKKRYKNYNGKLFKTNNMVYVPIYAQKHESAMAFSQDICNYTEKGRSKIHKTLSINKDILRYVKNSYVRDMSIEYNDNRISKFIAQKGKCAISKIELGFNDWHCHHKIPKKFKGDDRYNNLIILHVDIHKIIHMTKLENIHQILIKHKINKTQLGKINDLRSLAHMPKI